MYTDYSPTDETVFNGKDWVSYKQAVDEVPSREGMYELLDTLIESTREESVSDDTKRQLKRLINKMFP